jgi:hypothetical protein
MSQVLPSQPFLAAPRTQSNASEASEGRDATALAWQREMERAQMTQWFPASVTRIVATPVPAPAKELSRPPEQATGSIGAEVQKHKEPTPSDLAVDRVSSPVQSPVSRFAVEVHGVSLIAQSTQPQKETHHARITGVPVNRPGEACCAKPTTPAGASSDVFSARSTIVHKDTPAMSHHKPLLDVMGASRFQASSGSSSHSRPTPNGASEESTRAIPSERNSQAPRLGPSEIRCHAQWSAQGVNVWLGMDASLQEQARRLDGIIPQLQRTLGEQGHVLGAVVCNGRTVFQGHVPRPERTVPSGARDSMTKETLRVTHGSYKSLFEEE